MSLNFVCMGIKRYIYIKLVASFQYLLLTASLRSRISSYMYGDFKPWGVYDWYESIFCFPSYNEACRSWKRDTSFNTFSPKGEVRLTILCLPKRLHFPVSTIGTSRVLLQRLYELEINDHEAQQNLGESSLQSLIQGIPKRPENILEVKYILESPHEQLRSTFIIRLTIHQSQTYPQVTQTTQQTLCNIKPS